MVTRRTPANKAISKKPANPNRKKEQCTMCGGMRFHMKRHILICKGTTMQTRAAQVMGLRKGDKSKRGEERSTRASTEKAVSSVPLRPLLTCTSERGPWLTQAQLAFTPVEIRPPQQQRQALGVAGQDRFRKWGEGGYSTCSQDLRTAIHKVAGHVDKGMWYYKQYTSHMGVEEVELSNWSEGSSVRKKSMGAFCEELTQNPVPPHMYAFCTLEDEVAWKAAQEFAPIPKAYQAVVKPNCLILIVSSGGVNLMSHSDTSGGLLVLAKGHGAHGQVAFGDRLIFVGEQDPFRDCAGGVRDAKGCAWTVADLIQDGDTVFIPAQMPHAVRWGGVRLCVGYFTYE
jgi:ribosomal protein S14